LAHSTVMAAQDPENGNDRGSGETKSRELIPAQSV
jgi:hypothetical protein